MAQTGHERDRFKRERDRWKRERDRLKRQNERLTQLLGAARRAGFRQAAPFAKDRPPGRGGGPAVGMDAGRVARFPPGLMRPTRPRSLRRVRGAAGRWHCSA